MGRDPMTIRTNQGMETIDSHVFKRTIGGAEAKMAHDTAQKERLIERPKLSSAIRASKIKISRYSELETSKQEPAFLAYSTARPSTAKGGNAGRLESRPKSPYDGASSNTLKTVDTQRRGSRQPRNVQQASSRLSRSRGSISSLKRPTSAKRPVFLQGAATNFLNKYVSNRAKRNKQVIQDTLHLN